jgi:glycosyltransferase involved in cell wall biosynthesis
MNILMVSHYVPPAYSGAGAQALWLAQALAARGHSVAILASRFGGGASRETVGGVGIHRVGPRVETRLGHMWFYVALAGSLLVRAGRVDVIHVHGVFWPATMAAVVCRLAGTPLIVKCTRDGDDDPGTLASMREQRGLLGQLRYLPIAVCAAVVAINRAMESAAIREVGSNRTVFLPNAVDTEWFRPARPDEKANARATLGLGDRPVVLCPGGFIAHKGLRTLVQAVTEASFSGHADVLIVGANDPANPEVDASLANLVASYSSSRKVWWIASRCASATGQRMSSFCPASARGIPTRCWRACRVACPASLPRSPECARWVCRPTP